MTNNNLISISNHSVSRSFLAPLQPNKFLEPARSHALPYPTCHHFFAMVDWYRVGFIVGFVSAFYNFLGLFVRLFSRCFLQPVPNSLVDLRVDFPPLRNLAAKINETFGLNFKEMAHCLDLNKYNKRKSLKFLSSHHHQFRGSDTWIFGLAFDHSKFLKEIGADDISKVYTCILLNSSTSYYYAMKVVNKKILALKKNVNKAKAKRKS
ncbi:hypothetical protein F8388_018876 [Cannabis sativa]|uniref:Uncharacterized protein n=1 Tax=Cannabis sativa TaxID=3483 RepID=A0A7J6G043_CANSA|nr:hypothetical protein F8388_018876 [Cannabis sativa]